MHTKTIMQYYSILTRMAEMQNSIECRKDVKQQEFSYISSKSVEWNNFSEDWEELWKLNIFILCDLTVSLLNIYPTKYLRMFT